MDMKSFYKNKVIMVTGGCGSVGSALVAELVKYEPKRILIFDNSETKLYHMNQKLKGHENIRYLLGDIRDKNRLKIALETAEIVFHAAALKHVPLCEYNPEEAFKTNVIGTQNLIESARELNLDRVIGISTDKAVNPINTMGATKLLSEKLFLRAERGNSATKFSCVRFGNVLNSDGSVIPLFKKQIADGGPITLTSKDMTRFFMSLNQAANLVLEAGAICKGREIFILKMNALNILDLALSLIEELSPNKKIEIKEIGVRPGEKLYEVLVTEEEMLNVVENEKMYVLHQENIDPTLMHSDFKLLKNGKEIYSSNTIKLLSKSEIKSILKKENIL